MEALLGQLEIRLKTLLEKLDRLEQAHHGLKQDQMALAIEKKQLHDKQQHAISQIERMISRLKPLEENS